VRRCCRYLIYPKNFRKIASFLENKDTGACVTFYYSYKNMLNLKKLLREHQMKRRGMPRKGSNVPRELQNLGISQSEYWVNDAPSRTSRNRSVDAGESRSSGRGRKPSIMYAPYHLRHICVKGQGADPPCRAPTARDSRQRPSIMAGGRSGPSEKVEIVQRKNSQYEDGEDDEDYVDSEGTHAFRIQEELDGEDVDIIGNTPKPYQGTSAHLLPPPLNLLPSLAQLSGDSYSPV
jgi:hypothetical protein